MIISSLMYNFSGEFALSIIITYVYFGFVMFKSAFHGPRYDTKIITFYQTRLVSHDFDSSYSNEKGHRKLAASSLPIVELSHDLQFDCIGRKRPKGFDHLRGLDAAIV